MFLFLCSRFSVVPTLLFLKVSSPHYLCNFPVSFFQNKERNINSAIYPLSHLQFLAFSSSLDTFSPLSCISTVTLLTQIQWCLEPIYTLTMTSMKALVSYFFHYPSNLCSSVGKEWACNSGNPSLIPGSGRSTGNRIGYPLQYSWVSFVAHLVNKSACNAGDLGLIPRLGRSVGEGKGYPLQYPGLENSMDYCISPRGCKELDMTECLSLLNLYQTICLSYNTHQYISHDFIGNRHAHCLLKSHFCPLHQQLHF